MQAAPTEIDLIKDTIEVLTNSTAPPEEVLLALEALQSLLEPIDNANGKPAQGCTICTGANQGCCGPREHSSKVCVRVFIG